MNHTYQRGGSRTWSEWRPEAHENDLNQPCPNEPCGRDNEVPHRGMMVAPSIGITVSCGSSLLKGPHPLAKLLVLSYVRAFGRGRSFFPSAIR